MGLPNCSFRRRVRETLLRGRVARRRAGDREARPALEALEDRNLPSGAHGREPLLTLAEPPGQSAVVSLTRLTEPDDRTTEPGGGRNASGAQTGSSTSVGGPAPGFFSSGPGYPQLPIALKPLFSGGGSPRDQAALAALLPQSAVAVVPVLASAGSGELVAGGPGSLTAVAAQAPPGVNVAPVAVTGTDLPPSPALPAAPVTPVTTAPLTTADAVTGSPGSNSPAGTATAGVIPAPADVTATPAAAGVDAAAAPSGGGPAVVVSAAPQPATASPASPPSAEVSAPDGLAVAVLRTLAGGQTEPGPGGAVHAPAGTADRTVEVRPTTTAGETSVPSGQWRADLPRVDADAPATADEGTRLPPGSPAADPDAGAADAEALPAARDASLAEAGGAAAPVSGPAEESLTGVSVGVTDAVFEEAHTFAGATTEWGRGARVLLAPGLFALACYLAARASRKEREVDRLARMKSHVT
jgi:hypothetical protein